MSAAPRPGPSEGRSWWICSTSGIGAAGRLSWFPDPPGYSKLWWGVFGLCSRSEPVRTWEQPVCLSSPFPVPGGAGKACITWLCSLSVCPVPYLYVFVSEEAYLKSYNCGKTGQGHQTSCLSCFSAGFEFRFLVHFGFMDLLSLPPLLWRSCTLPTSKYSPFCPS